MDSELEYPQIMEPGQLKKLNDRAFCKIGTPIFFDDQDLFRPDSTDIRGRLYEVITGLYVIYKDCGIKMLSSFMSFCTRNNILPRDIFRHYNSVKILRGWLCHETLNKGKNEKSIHKEFKYYFGSENVSRRMSEDECYKLLCKLIEYANSFFKSLEDALNDLEGDSTLITEWRETLVENVFNGTKKNYGNNFFDGRIVGDIVDGIKSSSSTAPIQNTVKEWLDDINPKILAGKINAGELRDTLYQGLYDLYHPTSLSTPKSSVAILEDLFSN